MLGVNVFQLGGEGEVAAFDVGGDLVERGDDAFRLVGGDEADLGQHAAWAWLARTS